MAWLYTTVIKYYQYHSYTTDIADGEKQGPGIFSTRVDKVWEITCKQKMLVPHMHNPLQFLNYYKWHILSFTSFEVCTILNDSFIMLLHYIGGFCTNTIISIQKQTTDKKFAIKIIYKYLSSLYILECCRNTR